MKLANLVPPFFAFILVMPLQRRFDRSTLAFRLFGFLVVEKFLLYSLRIYFDVLPDNGDPLLPGIVVASAAIRTAVFSTARSLAGKATTGLGVFIGGLLLTYGLASPTDVGSVAEK